MAKDFEFAKELRELRAVTGLSASKLVEKMREKGIDIQLRQYQRWEKLSVDGRCPNSITQKVIIDAINSIIKSFDVEMQGLANKISERTNGCIVLTENILNLDDHWGYRYFLASQDKKQVYCEFENQLKAINEMKEILADGYCNGVMLREGKE